MSLAYSGKIIVRGLPGVEFAANDSLFDNGHKYPNMVRYAKREYVSIDKLLLFIYNFK